MDDNVRAQAEVMAAGMQAKVLERSKTWIAAEMVGMPALTEDEDATMDLGIVAGFHVTLQVLVEMGLLPSEETA